MADPIQLIVYLEGRNCVTSDEDGSGKLRFCYSASDREQAKRIMDLGGCEIIMTLVPREKG